MQRASSQQQQQVYSIFKLPQRIVDGLERAASLRDLAGPVDSIPSLPPSLSTPFPKHPPTSPPQDSDSSPHHMCSACRGISFPSLDTMKTHFKSDWHRYNQQRLLRRLPGVSEEAWEEMEDCSSIDASDDEDDEGEGDKLARSKAQGTPFLILPIMTSQATTAAEVQQEALLYKQCIQKSSSTRVATQESEDRRITVGMVVERLLRWQTDPCSWAIFMLTSGHFAGAVMDCRMGKVLAHKTFHRYTTRRKQGGAQSSSDNAKGKAKSAGSTLRRYNEQALQEDIANLLKSWTPLIQAASLIFVQASKNCRKYLFFDPSEGGLGVKDDRIRSFPFVTKRPTNNEVIRCFEQVSILTIRPRASMEATVEMVKDKLSLGTPSLSTEKNRTPTPEPIVSKAKLPDSVQKLLDFLRRGKVELFKTELSKISAPQIDAFINQELGEEFGGTLLHVAASTAVKSTTTPSALPEASSTDTVEESKEPETEDIDHLKTSGSFVTHLLMLGANPCAQWRKKRPYDVAIQKEVRDEFRRYMYWYPEAWDYKETGIPSPLSPEMEEEQRAKEREKKKRQREKDRARQKEKAAAAAAAAALLPESSPATPTASSSTNSKRFGSQKGSGAGILKLSSTELQSSRMDPAMRARLDREKRAVAAEARMRNAQGQCASCAISLSGRIPFEKGAYKYCSLDCIGKQGILH